MRQRVMILFIVLAAMLGASAYAAGASEDAASGLPWESVKLTGTVSFKDLPHPELTVGGKVYELLVPLGYADDLKVKAGDTITVEGVLVDNARAGSTEQYLRVSEAVIGGKTYEVPLRGGWRGMGCGWDDRADGRPFGRGGMMGGGRW